MDVVELDQDSQEMPMSMDADAWVPGLSGGGEDTQTESSEPVVLEANAGEISDITDSMEVQEAVGRIKPGMEWVPGAWRGKGKRPSLNLLRREVRVRDGTKKPAQWTFDKCIQFLLANEPISASSSASPCQSEVSSTQPGSIHSESTQKPAQRWTAHRSGVRMLHCIVHHKEEFITRDRPMRTRLACLLACSLACLPAVF